MCGIFAAINMNGSFNADDLICFERSTALTFYRGPDAKKSLCINTFQKKNSKENFNVFLGHNRLSIIDLSEDGNQPMEDNGNIIIFNGEIFNYLELKNNLIKQGVNFKTKSDTEVILKIYEKYGENSFNLLNGMWAFILVDLKKNKIVISRDRFSIKPLYYYNKNSVFYFASEIKQLLPFLPKKELNEQVMFNFLQQGLIDINENTFYKNILKVKPKTNFILKLNEKEILFENYWDFEEKEINEKNYLDEFKELFFDSVRLRLRSDVEVGALLSGGLDSSAISLAANKLMNGNIKTFSVVSNDKDSSEEKFVDILIKEKGIKNHKLFIEHKDILKNLDDVIKHQDEPFNTLSVVAQYTILEQIKKHTNIIVVLSGQGGDELMMGYLKYYFFYLKDLLREKKLIKFSKEIITSIISQNILFKNKIGLSKRYLPFMVKKQVNYLTINGALENPWEFKNLVERQELDIDKFSIPILTRYEDRNSMAHSLETRLPFLDHRLVNFLLNLKQFKN